MFRHWRAIYSYCTPNFRCGLVCLYLLCLPPHLSLSSKYIFYIIITTRKQCTENARMPYAMASHRIVWHGLVWQIQSNRKTKLFCIYCASAGIVVGLVAQRNFMRTPCQPNRRWINLSKFRRNKVFNSLRCWCFIIMCLFVRSFVRLFVCLCSTITNFPSNDKTKYWLTA